MYANSNVDILHDNGKVFNIPDIKNAILTTAKGINDVSFTVIEFIWLPTLVSLF